MRSIFRAAGASRGLRVLGLVPLGAAAYWSHDVRCAPAAPKLSPSELHPNVVVLESRAIQVGAYTEGGLTLGDHLASCVIRQPATIALLAHVS